jgi:hypothetical protein
VGPVPTDGVAGSSDGLRLRLLAGQDSTGGPTATQLCEIFVSEHSSWMETFVIEVLEILSLHKLLDLFFAAVAYGGLGCQVKFQKFQILFPSRYVFGEFILHAIQWYTKR